MSSLNPGLLVESGGVNNMSASFNSDALYLGARGKVGMHARTNGGTHVGTFAVEAGSDGTNWCTISLDGEASIPLVSGTALAAAIDLELNQSWVRVVYTYTSGNGQLDVVVTRRRND